MMQTNRRYKQILAPKTCCTHTLSTSVSNPGHGYVRQQTAAKVLRVMRDFQLGRVSLVTNKTSTRTIRKCHTAINHLEGFKTLLSKSLLLPMSGLQESEESAAAHETPERSVYSSSSHQPIYQHCSLISQAPLQSRIQCQTNDMKFLHMPL